MRAAAAAVADAVAQEPARPIVRNRRIERLDAPVWEADSLPLDALVSCLWICGAQLCVPQLLEQQMQWLRRRWLCLACMTWPVAR